MVSDPTGWTHRSEAGGPFIAEAEQLGRQGWEEIDPDHLFQPGNWHPEYVKGFYAGRQWPTTL